MPRIQVVPADDTVVHLKHVLEWVKGNRGSTQGNPFCVPEVKGALKHLANLQGIDDYLSAVTRE